VPIDAVDRKPDVTSARVPLEAHAELGDQSHRDVLKTLRGQDEARVAELVPIRWGRMSVSPFTFYRGAAAVMAADLAATPRSKLQVQLCGDAHLSNFGLFAAYVTVRIMSPWKLGYAGRAAVIAT
jgi:hypothetical protein